LVLLLLFYAEMTVPPRATAGRPHRDVRRTEAPPHRLADDRVAGGAQYQETLSFYTVVDAVIDRYS
jgi:hypothetical protein